MWVRVHLSFNWTRAVQLIERTLIIGTAGVWGIVTTKTWDRGGGGGSVYFFPRFSDPETGTTHRPKFPSHSLYMAVFGRNFTQLGWDEPKPPFVFLSISVFAVSWSHGLSAGKLFAAAPLPPTWLTDIWLSWYTGINQSSYQHVVFSLRPFISSFCLPVLQPLSKQS